MLSVDDMKKELLRRQEQGELIDPKIGHILHQAFLLGVPEIIALYQHHIVAVLET